MSVQVAVG